MTNFLSAGPHNALRKGSLSHFTVGKTEPKRCINMLQATHRGSSRGFQHSTPPTVPGGDLPPSQLGPLCRRAHSNLSGL